MAKKTKKKIEWFTYTTEDGAEITLKKPKSVINVGFVRKNRNVSDQERMWRLLELCADEENLDLIDEIPEDEMEEFVAAWTSDEEAPAGES